MARWGVASHRASLPEVNMPANPKPFYHRGAWKTDVGGRRTKLVQGPKDRKHERLAKEALKKLLAQTPEERAAGQLAVWEVCEQFLDWVELHRSRATFTDYHICLSRWVALHGRRPVASVKALDLEQWKAALVKEGYKPCSINHHIVAVQTCWNWSVKMDLLPANPLRKVEKLPVEGRQRVLTPDECRRLLRHSDARFRQVWLVFWLTGMRPGEFCKIAWDSIDWERCCFVLRKHKSSRTAKEPRPRVIPFPPCIEKLLRRAQAAGQMAPFGAWTYNALRCRMRRLRDRAGLGSDVTLYTARHSYATRAFNSGVADRRLAELLGHATTRMTAKYQHPDGSTLHPDARKATMGAIAP
jgi:integrase